MKITINTKSKVQGWRLKYFAQGGNQNPDNQPAVTPSQYGYGKYAPPIQFTRQLQFLSWELTQRTNPWMTSMHWASVWNGDTWGTNQNGWDNEEDLDDQRHDYVNNRYTTYKDPLLMDTVITAGNLFVLEDRGDGYLWTMPGVSGINVYEPLPTVDEILRRRHYFRLTINPKPGKNPYDFAQGQQHPNGVVVPYFVPDVPVPYRKEYFYWWDKPYYPNPLIFDGGYV